MPLEFRDFRRQSPRLLRQKWKTPESLAQELYAMMTTDATGFPSYAVEETKAGTPQFVLDRMKQQLSDLTIQQAESRQQGLPGFIPPPPTPLESLGD